MTAYWQTKSPHIYLVILLLAKHTQNFLHRKVFKPVDTSVKKSHSVFFTFSSSLICVSISPQDICLYKIFVSLLTFVWMSLKYICPVPVMVWVHGGGRGGAGGCLARRRGAPRLAAAGWPQAPRCCWWGTAYGIFRLYFESLDIFFSK